jgi:hypothetical protein
MERRCTHVKCAALTIARKKKSGSMLNLGMEMPLASDISVIIVKRLTSAILT